MKAQLTRAQRELLGIKTLSSLLDLTERGKSPFRLYTPDAIASNIEDNQSYGLSIEQRNVPDLLRPFERRKWVYQFKIINRFGENNHIAYMIDPHKKPQMEAKIEEYKPKKKR